MEDLDAAFSSLMGDHWMVTDSRGVSGGCISEAREVVATDGDGQSSRWFVKSNEEMFLENFQAEKDGLHRLHQSQAIRVPLPVAVGRVGNRSWMVSEWIGQGHRGRDFFSMFGHALARLHRCTLGNRIGLKRDNFLGATRQSNAPCLDWIEFVADRRLGFQIQQAVDRRMADRELIRDCERIVAGLHELLDGRLNQTSLLHGDLWSGNYLCDELGGPVILDPAVYYGCREAEFGMLRLFGSCPPEFYDAYEAAFPFPAGWQRRVNVYVLYHLLNHLNLFGRGYHDQCRTLAAEILRG